MHFLFHFMPLDLFKWAFKSLKIELFCRKYPSVSLAHLSMHQSHMDTSEGFVLNRKEQLCTILLYAERLSVSCYEVIYGCSYLWP